MFECCDFAMKRFIDNSKLKRHLLVHTGERRFKCSYEGCNKRFALDFNLKSHMRVHTGEKPFACTHPGCGRRFAQVSNLRAHDKTHRQQGTGQYSDGDTGEEWDRRKCRCRRQQQWRRRRWWQYSRSWVIPSSVPRPHQSQYPRNAVLHGPPTACVDAPLPSAISATALPLPVPPTWCLSSSSS